MPVPVTKKEEKEKPVVPVPKKQLVKLNFNPMKTEKKVKLAEKSPRKVASHAGKKGETKIGWFKYYKSAELFTDENGKKQIMVRHKWAKIPTPKKAKVSKSPEDSG